MMSYTILRGVSRKNKSLQLLVIRGFSFYSAQSQRKIFFRLDIPGAEVESGSKVTDGVVHLPLHGQGDGQVVVGFGKAPDHDQGAAEPPECEHFRHPPSDHDEKPDHDAFRLIYKSVSFLIEAVISITSFLRYISLPIFLFFRYHRGRTMTISR